MLRYRAKLIILATIIILGFANLIAAQPIITEVLYDVSSRDDGYEWVELYNLSDSPIDLSNYSLGYGGDDYTYGKSQLSGEIQPHSCFVVGGPESEEKNADPKYDQIENFDPDIQNSGSKADGVALFDVPANQITFETIPIDTVIYGKINEKSLLDNTDEPGDVDVEDAPDDSSIESTLKGWRVQNNPNPGEYSPAPLLNTIPWVQNDGDVSPYVGEVVDGISGVVVAYITSKRGFFMQDPLGDFNRTTSDGIFVYKGNNSSIPYIDAGDKVSVTGKVEEHNGLTQLNVSEASSEVKIISSGNDLPAPVELDPPAILDDALSYFESREGMLVSAPDGVVVGPTDKYGEFVIVRQHAFKGRYFYNPYNQNGERIVVDDAGGIRVNVKLDDIVENIVGILDYSYGNYKIDATEQFQVTSGELPTPIPSIDRANEFTIASFNLENFFDNVDDQGKDDAVLTEEKYNRKKLKIALAIKDGLHAPDIIAVQETEKLEVLEELAEHSELSEFDYASNLIEGVDSRGIDVGLLTRSDRVKVVELRQEQAPNPLDDGRVHLFSRPPLVATLDVYREEIDVGEARRFYLIVCHFKSMSGGEAETEPRRTEQARFVASLVDDILEDKPDAKVAVLGDLNCNRTTTPIAVLTNGTTPGSQLKKLNSKIELGDQYSYIYEGKAQYLDYILVTDAVSDLTKKVYATHINAGFPYSHEADDTLHRSSDHDPILATFFFEKITGDLSGDGKVTAYDASLILQFVVGLIDEFPVENMAIPQAITSHDRAIRIPVLSAKARDSIRVPIFVDNTDDLFAGGVTIRFDASVLKPTDVMSNLNGAYFQSKIDGVERAALPVVEPVNEIRFAFIKLKQDTSHGNRLATIEFELIGEMDGITTALAFDQVRLVRSSSIKTVDGSITFLTSKAAHSTLPERTALLQNYPNPFNPETWIPYELAKTSPVELKIYSVTGQLVRNFELGTQSPGCYISRQRAFYWDGRSELGEKVTSGIYFYVLKANDFTAKRKMVILK